MLLGRRLAFRAQVRSAIAPQIFLCYLFARSPVWSSTVKGQPSPPGESYRLGQLPSFPVGGFQRLLNRAIPIGSIVVPFWGSYLESYKVFPRRNYYGAYGYPDETRNYTPRAEKSPQTGSPKLISRREKSLISFSKRVEQGATQKTVKPSESPNRGTWATKHCVGILCIFVRPLDNAALNC